MDQVTTTTKRIHPLMAGAACSVILVSLLGAAAITGLLPSSNSTTAPVNTTGQAAMTANQGMNQNLPNQAMAQGVNPGANQGMSQGMGQSMNQPGQSSKQNAYPGTYQGQTAGNYNNAPASRVAQASQPQQRSNHSYHPQQPAAQNSPVGIGVGAVIGGLIGSQVGNGNGRTLATIAGAVGGGYVGNEVAKRNP